MDEIQNDNPMTPGMGEEEMPVVPAEGEEGVAPEAAPLMPAEGEEEAAA